MTPAEVTALAPPLPRAFYLRDVPTVARELLGQLVIRRTRGGLVIGRIVETEAYLANDDPASHSFRGPTRRNAAMFGPPGHAYVYTIHTRFCLNAVTEARGVGSAVLIRALEPLHGVDVMRGRRGIERLEDLARGPGRLCEACDIDRALDAWDLTRGTRLWIAGGAPCADVTCGPRIGISQATELPLRFCAAGSRWVSGRRNHPARREASAAES